MDRCGDCGERRRAGGNHRAVPVGEADTGPGGHGAQGICALAAVNVAGAFTGVSLGLNLLSGLSCVVLGIPGVVTLLFLKLIFNG